MVEMKNKRKSAVLMATLATAHVELSLCKRLTNIKKELGAVPVNKGGLQSITSSSKTSFSTLGLNDFLY